MSASGWPGFIGKPIIFSDGQVTATGDSTPRALSDWFARLNGFSGGIQTVNIRTPDAGLTRNFGGAASGATNSIFHYQTVISGAVLSNAVTGYASPHSIIINDIASAEDALMGFSIVHSVGAAVGVRVASHSFIKVNGVITPGDTGNSEAISSMSLANASVNQGGSGTITGNNPNTGYVGSLWGGNDNAWLTSAATNFYGVYGREINVMAHVNANPFAKIGLFIVKGLADASNAFADDAAIAIGQQGQDATTTPFKRGIQFGVSWSAWPFGDASTLIGAVQRIYSTTGPAPTALYGVDFSNIEFTTGGAPLVVPLMTPASSAATGKKGSILVDENYLHVCVDTNTWKHAALSPHPGYTAGRYYPTTTNTVSISAAVPATNTVYLYLFYVPRTVTITHLGARVVTGQSGSAIKTGIWANLNGRPYGAPLAADNTGVATETTGSTVDSPAAITLQTGWYWFGSKCTGTLPTLVSLTALHRNDVHYGVTSLASAGHPALSIASTYANDMPTFTDSETWGSVQAAGVPVLWLKT